MDVSHGTSTAAKAAASGAEADAAPSPQLTAAPTGQEKRLPAASADPAPVTGLTATTSTTVPESGVDDEQVEKFYTLVANIRAMRSMHKRISGSGDAGASTEDTTSDVHGGVRKRARWAEQPWRPVFRMEEFAEVQGGGASRKDGKEDGTAATSQRRGKDTTGEAADGEGDAAGRKDRRVS